MFAKILEAISSLFKALFGGGDKSGDTKEPRNQPELKPIEELPQDGSEIRPDTIVIVADEMDHVVIDPNQPDVDFDEDIFEDEEEEEESAPEVVIPESEVPETEEEPTPEEEPKHKARYLWCLDNGHGKATPGKRSPVFDDGVTQLFEYEFNRDIVARMMKALDENGVQYYNVVPEVEGDITLEERVKRANRKKTDLEGGKIYVSIHSNAAPAKNSRTWGPASVNGVETWFYHGSKRGQKVASVFQKEILKATGWNSRKIKSRPNSQFYVLRKTKMTAVLTENGFYNNKQQALELVKDEVRQAIADAHVAAIMELELNGI